MNGATAPRCMEANSVATKLDLAIKILDNTHCSGVTAYLHILALCVTFCTKISRHDNRVLSDSPVKGPTCLRIKTKPVNLI